MEKTGNMRKNLKNSGSNMANIKDRLEREAEVDFGRRAVDFQEMGNFLRVVCTGLRGQDYNAELQLSLRDAAETHKQVLTVNNKKIRITIPAGVEDGQTIKLSGQGGPGANGGPAGDLYITFVIPDDPVYKREGNNLYRTAPLDLYTAVLGGEQVVETLGGKVKLKVKPETQNNTKVRLRGKGFPVYKQEGQYGDLIVTWSVKIPTDLSDKQKELFRELQRSH